MRLRLRFLSDDDKIILQEDPLGRVVVPVSQSLLLDHLMLQAQLLLKQLLFFLVQLSDAPLSKPARLIVVLILVDYLRVSIFDVEKLPLGWGVNEQLLVCWGFRCQRRIIIIIVLRSIIASLVVFPTWALRTVDAIINRGGSPTLRIPKLLSCLFYLLQQSLIILLVSVDLRDFVKHKITRAVLIGGWNHSRTWMLHFCIISMLTHASFRSVDISSWWDGRSKGLQGPSRLRELALGGHPRFRGEQWLLICLISRILRALDQLCGSLPDGISRLLHALHFRGHLPSHLLMLSDQPH